MPATWADIITGVATNLRTVSEALNVVDYYSDSLNVPVGGVAEVGPQSGQGQLNAERALVNGVWVYSLTVSLYLNTVVEKAAQTRMLAYMSIGNDLSVWNALDQLGALIGVAEKVIVLRSHSYGNIVREDRARLITNSWDLSVWAAGD